MPETNGLCIFVDPYGGENAARANRKGLKDAIAWLEARRIADRVSGRRSVAPESEGARHHRTRNGTTVWPRLIRITGATVLPIYLLGANSALFQVLGFLHPRVRTALLPHEFFNKHDRTIEVRIGSPIAPAKIRAYQDDVALIRYLRHRTYLLQNREAPAGLTRCAERTASRRAS